MGERRSVFQPFHFQAFFSYAKQDSKDEGQRGTILVTWHRLKQVLRGGAGSAAAALCIWLGRGG